MVHPAHLFSFHESLLRCSNVFGWSKIRWSRPAPALKVVYYMRKPPLSVAAPPSPLLTSSFLPAQAEATLFQLLVASTSFFIYPLFSFWTSSPPPGSLFLTKTLCTYSPKPSLHSALTSGYYCQLCFHTNPSEQVLCSLSNITVHVNQLQTSVRMQIDSVGARESASLMSTQMPAMLEDSRSVPSLSSHSSPADVHFFHLSETEMVSTHHRWSSHPQIQCSCLCPHLLPSVHSIIFLPWSPTTLSLKFSFFGLADTTLFWIFFHRKLQFPLIAALPSLATLKNLITTQVMIVKFSIYSLAYRFSLSFFLGIILWIQCVLFKRVFPNGPFSQFIFQPPTSH